jgi:U3 small nucleolar RNA-associated protein 12
MRTALIQLRRHLRLALQRQKGIIGYNLAALRYLRRRNDSERTAEFLEENMTEEIVRSKIAEGRKRKRVTVKA